MVKKRGRKSSRKKNGKNEHPTRHETHPVLREDLSFGQRAADFIANFGGSWPFIIFFAVFLISWMMLNVWYLSNEGFDPYPFILLNLVLSTLAAFQAPIILMAQNRQTERDRIDAKYDHAINRKAEREIQQIQKDLASIRSMLRRMHHKEVKKIESRAKSVIRRINRK